MDKATYQQLNIRVPPRMVKELEEIAYEEQLTKTDVARRLLGQGIRQWKMEYALRLYQEGRVTKERAAEIADLSLYEILDAVRRRNIPSHYTLEDAIQDIDEIVKRATEASH
jgi:predicted HTH domain antitoxin